jgi:MFS family permease
VNLVDRAKNIILTPALEWNVIEPEITTPKELYLGYIMILAAIGPVASFLSSTLFHFFFGSLFFSLLILIVTYVVGLVMVFVMALIADFLAPKFGGISSQMQALKLMAYALTPAWIAGIFHLIPFVGALLGLLAALYGLYVFYLGATPMMKVPADKAAGYTAVVVVVAIVFGIVLSSFAFMFGGLGTGMMMSGMNNRSVERQERANVAAAQIAAITAAAAVNATANANANSNSNTAPVAANNAGAAQSAAAVNAIAAMAGAANGQTVDPVDKDILKAMLPDTVASLPRTGTEASKGGMATMQISEADGDYGDNQGKHVKLKVLDTGGAKMFGLAAAWAAVEVDRSTDTGYEKTGKVAGRPTHEKFDKNSQSGEYAVLIGDRFLVEADGTNVDMAALKDGVAAVDPAKLEAMKDLGVKKTN